MPAPFKIFVIYAREDSAFLKELRGQLRPLEIAGRIKLWSDSEINPGADWEKEIKEQLDLADIVIILISAAYYDSAYIHENEIKKVIQRHETGTAKVLPVIIKPCSWNDDPHIRQMQVLPRDGHPVTDKNFWPQHDYAWLDVVNGLKRVLSTIETEEIGRLQTDMMEAEAVQKTEKNLPWLKLLIGAGVVCFAVMLYMVSNDWVIPYFANYEAGNSTGPEQSGQLLVNQIPADTGRADLSVPGNKPSNHPVDKMPEKDSSSTLNAGTVDPKKVESPKPKLATISNSGRWQVHCGAFVTLGGAKRRLEEVIKLGYPAAEVNKVNPKYWAVIAYRSNDKREALRKANELENKGIDAAVFDTLK